MKPELNVPVIYDS